MPAAPEQLPLLLRDMVEVSVYPGMIPLDTLERFQYSSGCEDLMGGYVGSVWYHK